MVTLLFSSIVSVVLGHLKIEICPFSGNFKMEKITHEFQLSPFVSVITFTFLLQQFSEGRQL